jgi:hypothetical protein
VEGWVGFAHRWEWEVVMDEIEIVRRIGQLVEDEHALEGYEQ